MAATNYTPIQLYRTTTAAAVPSAANLAAGELAINTTDEKLYFKNTSGTVKLLATSAMTSGTVTSVAADGGATGLTFTGSPITSSGTLTLGGTLVIANGGTGSTTASGARTALAVPGLADTNTFTGANAFRNTATYIGPNTGTSDGTLYFDSTNVYNITYFRNGGTNYGSFIGQNTIGLFHNFDNHIFRNGAGSTEYARFNSSGNLGLGQNSPASKLDVNGGYSGNVVTVSASAIDCSLGNYFIKTAAGALTWTFTSVPSTRAFSVLLELTNGGTGTQTWPASVKWPGGTAPTLTTSGVDLLGFITDDSGTTWRGVQLMKDSK